MWKNHNFETEIYKVVAFRCKSTFKVSVVLLKIPF